MTKIEEVILAEAKLRKPGVGPVAGERDIGLDLLGGCHLVEQLKRTEDDGSCMKDIVAPGAGFAYRQDARCHDSPSTRSRVQLRSGCGDVKLLVCGRGAFGRPAREAGNVFLGVAIGAVVFIPEEMLHLPSEEKVGLMQLAVGPNELPTQVLRACLAKVSVKPHGAKKRTLASVSEPLAGRFAGKRLEARWVRLEGLPASNMPRDLLAAVASVEPGLAKPSWQPLSVGGDISVVGVVVPEEVHQGEWQDTWLFVVTLRERLNAPETRYIARGERLTPTDLQSRLPVSARLHEKTVGLVGLGSLGAPIAAELLRAQVGELRVLDFDRVEVGNIVRWPHGLSAVNNEKAAVLGGWAAMEYPFSRVKSISFRIGAVPIAADTTTPETGEAQGLSEFLDGLDLLIDASAELVLRWFNSFAVRVCGGHAYSFCCFNRVDRRRAVGAGELDAASQERSGGGAEGADCADGRGGAVVQWRDRRSAGGLAADSHEVAQPVCAASA
jgi:hypothetical protein